jgi:molybdopterin-containing oxidoreductase family iron-sulfur binding subunit
MNGALGSLGNTVTLLSVADADRPTHAAAIAQLAKDLNAGAVKTLLILGGNPAYDAPATLELEKLISAVQNSIHVSSYRNETSLAATWHLPKAHYLECWGDARAYDGTVSIQQPLIEPLFGGISSIELLAMITGDEVRAGRALVQRAIGANEADFRRALHDGVVADSAFKPASSNLQPVIAGATTQPVGPPSAIFEVRFLSDASVYDGRFANNGWLQEMPDPLSKLTWDNAALISKPDADKLDVENGSMLSITVDGRSIRIPAFILPGQPIGVVSLPLGYNRRAAGNIGTGVGFDTYVIRPANGFSAAADVKNVGGSYNLVATQEHHIIDEVGFKGREERIGEKHQSGIVIRETTLAEYQKNPRSAHPHGHGNVKLQLFDPPYETPPKHEHAPLAFNQPNAWGMAIDMTACIGCNACVVACVSENNIPVVGKEMVAVNREMHWIRIDRYFKGAMDDPNPEVTFQPMMCVHCENAPCEQVCPVAATMHDTEGLNTMVYNRCIGTRYCSNNCPYKVRRFNYFDFHSIGPKAGRFPAPYPNMPDLQQREQVDPIRALQFNPDVTVRMRGVMEKCTYCVQRIQGTKIRAKNDFLAGKRDSEMIKDNEVITACQQACPTQAIIFGNLNDRDAQVTKLHQNPRAYSVLEELNTRPRSQHLARVRNPSAALEGAERPPQAEQESHH